MMVLAHGRSACRGMIVPLVVLALAGLMAPQGTPRALDEPAPALESGTGSLHGVVRLGRHLTERRMRFSLYPDTGPAAPLPAPTDPAAELANVVVFLEDAPGLRGAGAAPPGPFRMEQQRQAFLPHVLPVIAGSTVEFPNGDPIYHNVFSLSKASSFDLGRYPKGSTRVITFDRPGVVKVFCHIHSDMSAVVMVMPHAFFTSPGSQGAYRLTGIPPGRYTVTGWHERARPLQREVLIEAGADVVMNLDIPIEDPADGR